MPRTLPSGNVIGWRPPHGVISGEAPPSYRGPRAPRSRFFPTPRLDPPRRNRKQLKEKRIAYWLPFKERCIEETEYELACMEPLPEALSLYLMMPSPVRKTGAEQPGQRIQTSVRQALQRQTQALVNRYAREYSSNHIHNLAAIVADVETGRYWPTPETLPIRPTSGGEPSGHHHLARSTGSILKPFLYAGMLHDGLLLPSMLVSDVPLNINGFSP